VADEGLGDKTEMPTQRRLEEARERGQVPRSQDLTAAIVLLAAVAALMMTSGQLMQSLAAMLREMLQFGDVHTKPVDEVFGETIAAAKGLALALAPLLGAILLAAIAGNLIQSGPAVSTHPLIPSFDKIDPIKGFGRIFSKRSGMRLVSNLAKLIAIVWISYVVIAGDCNRIVALSGAGAEEIAGAGADIILGLGLKLAAIFIVLAIFDYMYQRWQYTQDLMMTKQEIREEMKRMEGDPTIREHRRHMQRQMAMKRMAADIPKADVVITNPTHFAIAIRYDADTMAAPKVVAKGADLLAKRIREIAVEHGVPIVEKPALARALYRAVEVGREVPMEFYKSVAEVLAFVYRMANRQFRPTRA